MKAKKVMLLGATGTIGRATYFALRSAGYEVIAPVRNLAKQPELAVETLRQAKPEDVLASEQIDAVISCIASRTGLDAWDVDYGINSATLKAADVAGVSQYVLLSAICVQKPKLPFQRAKLAFEEELKASSLSWSIVRPTAFFKSLSGQIGRVQSGKPFLLFGDGALTACKPISDRDCATYLVRCLSDSELQGRVLPIGGPGPAMTPKKQGDLLFEALGAEPRYARVPVAMMRAIIAGLTPLGVVSRKLREKAELARIGHYYATESMLVWDAEAQAYSPEKTPEFGEDRLIDHYRALISGDVADDRGAHAVF